MIERSEALLRKRKLSESHAALRQKPKPSNTLRQKAFWVANQYQSEATLPRIQSQNPRAGNQSQPATPRGAREAEELKRLSESPDPVPISKDERLTLGDDSGDVKLVQQYVMVRGRLQPALKYVAQIPMFNRYKVNRGTKGGDFQEIVTYPTVTGDLSMDNRHVGVNFDDRDMPAKALPREPIEAGARADLEGVVKSLQSKSIRYNRQYYERVARRDRRQADPDEIEDPRSLDDIERENLDLKEQTIHMMMTMEQYLAVALVWQAEQEEGYNPFERDYADLQNEINRLGEGSRVAEDGWIDYADGINTIAREEELERHEEKFDPNAALGTQGG